MLRVKITLVDSEYFDSKSHLHQSMHSMSHACVIWSLNQTRQSYFSCNSHTLSCWPEAAIFLSHAFLLPSNSMCRELPISNTLPHGSTHTSFASGAVRRFCSIQVLQRPSQHPISRMCKPARPASLGTSSSTQLLCQGVPENIAYIQLMEAVQEFVYKTATTRIWGLNSCLFVCVCVLRHFFWWSVACVMTVVCTYSVFDNVCMCVEILRAKQWRLSADMTIRQCYTNWWAPGCILHTDETCVKNVLRFCYTFVWNVCLLYLVMYALSFIHIPIWQWSGGPNINCLPFMTVKPVDWKVHVADCWLALSHLV